MTRAKISRSQLAMVRRMAKKTHYFSDPSQGDVWTMEQRIKESLMEMNVSEFMRRRLTKVAGRDIDRDRLFDMSAVLAVVFRVDQVFVLDRICSSIQNGDLAFYSGNYFIKYKTDSNFESLLLPTQQGLRFNTRRYCPLIKLSPTHWNLSKTVVDGENFTNAMAEFSYSYIKVYKPADNVNTTLNVLEIKLYRYEELTDE